MYSIFVAYLILIAYIVITGIRRKTTLEVGPVDQRSTRLLSLAIAINITLLILAIDLNYLQIGLMADVIGWIGIAVMLCGIALRMWAFRTLGGFYTPTLRISESQRVVQDGPYKYVRHPGYLGVILLLVGAGLATVNWIIAALVTFIAAAAYRYRINAEERMLVAAFGEQYAAYMKHTWRLLPFVW
jgi:protein-S-isoprenylcysteine O-methyltransferase Ste14